MGDEIHIKSISLGSVPRTHSTNCSSAFVSFHSVDDTGQLSALVDVSEPIELTCDGDGFLVCDIKLTEPVIVAVLHEVGDDAPIGLAKCNTGTINGFSAKLQEVIETDVPQFAKCAIELTLVVFPHVFVRFTPLRVPVGYISLFGGVVPPSLVDDYRIELSVMRGARRVGSTASSPTRPKSELGISFIELTEELTIDYIHDPRNSYSVEISLHTPDAVVLLDVMPLKIITLGPVQSLPFSPPAGILSICHGSTFDSSSPAFLAARTRMQLSKVQRCHTAWFIMQVNTLDADVEKFIVGTVRLGTRPMFSIDSFSTHDVSETVSFSVVTGVEYPVLGIAFLDMTGSVVATCTLPLASCLEGSTVEYPGIGFSIKIKPLEGANSPAEPLLPIWEDESPDVTQTALSSSTGSMVSVRALLQKATKLPIDSLAPDATSVFITMSVCSSALPPGVLNVAELFRMRDAQHPDEFPTYSLAESPHRIANLRNPIFESEVCLHAKTKHSDWIWFVMYACTQVGQLTVLGHCSIPVATLTCTSKQTVFTLPVLDGVDRCRHLDVGSYLYVSFPSPPTLWTPIIIRQDTTRGDTQPDTICLQVRIYTSQLHYVHRTEHPVGEGRIWLPIKDIYPLYIREGPPESYMVMSLLSVESDSVAESHHMVKPRVDPQQFPCGKFNFLVTRSKHSQ
jgi:hypothetical protein